MKASFTLSVVWLALLLAPVLAQEWTRTLKDRSERGKLSDLRQSVRGDSGKWNDDPILQHTPSVNSKPSGMALDAWADLMAEKPFQATSNDENGLVFRTRQLDDNDRVWVERIERRGNQFTIVMNEAVWEGRYSKNFTCYEALAVNLGKLEPGRYEVKWIVKPLRFTQFEGDGRPRENWPRDEQPGDGEPTALTVSFTVAAP